MEKRKIYLWGFQEEEERQWPPDLEPVFSTAWPSDAPVIIHRSAIERFQAEALNHPMPDGRMPDAILYLPRGEEAPSEAWDYFDATVQEGDWPRLRALLACPQQFRMGEMAEELSATFLQGVDRAIEDLGLQDFPLPQEVLGHLAACSACRDAFYHSLEGRLRLRRQMLCPSTDRLASYVRGIPDPRVERHLESCRLCRAEVTVLQREFALMPILKTWLSVPLEGLGRTAPVGIDDESLRRALGVLAILTVGCAKRHLIPRVARTRGITRTRGVGGAPEEDKLTSLLIEHVHLEKPIEVNKLIPLLEGHVRLGKPISLRRAPQALNLGWDSGQQAFWVGDLSGDGQIRDFQIEVRRGSEVLWGGRSQQGKVWIPLENLEHALQSGADQMIILAKE